MGTQHQENFELLKISYQKYLYNRPDFAFSTSTYPRQHTNPIDPKMLTDQFLGFTPFLIISLLDCINVLATGIVLCICPLLIKLSSRILSGITLKKKKVTPS